MSSHIALGAMVAIFLICSINLRGVARKKLNKAGNFNTLPIEESYVLSKVCQISAFEFWQFLLKRGLNAESRDTKIIQ
jgi:hypothetical protein